MLNHYADIVLATKHQHIDIGIGSYIGDTLILGFVWPAVALVSSS